MATRSGYDSDTHTAPHLPHSPFAHVAEPVNKIGDGGARALANGIKHLTGIKNLYLGGECVIGCWPSPTVAHDIHTRLAGAGMGGRVVYGCER